VNKRSNAQKHGAFSKITILPGEDPEELEALLADVNGEYQPEGATEEHIVLNLAQAIWQRRRLDKFAVAQLNANTYKPDRLGYDEVAAFERFRDGLEISCEIQGSVNYWERCFRFLSDAVAGNLRKQFPHDEAKSHEEWVAAVVSKVDTSWVPLARHRATGLRQELLAKSADYLPPDSFLAQAELHERLEANIDRCIKRLAQVNAFKDVLRSQKAASGKKAPPQISSKAADGSTTD
jgi:hypothetical protein